MEEDLGEADLMFTDQILRGTLQDTLGPEVQPDGPFWDYCLRRTMGLGGPSPDTIDCRLRVCCPVVAIGAPAGTYLPRVGDVLGTEVLLPSHAAVAGAVGAIVSGVVERCEILIKPVAATHYLVVLPDKKEILEDLEAAVELAVTEGRRVAAARARRAGAYQVHLEVSRRDRRAAAAYNEEQDVYLETVITVTATGRPTPRSETDSC